MYINSSMVFFWLKKKYPSAVHRNPGYFLSEELLRPLFPGTREEAAQHIVVVPPSSDEQFVSSVLTCLPIFVGGLNENAVKYPIESILLPGVQDVGGVFNVVQEIFDRFETWQRELEDAVEKQFSYDAIIRSCDALIEDPLALADNHFRYVSFSWKLAHDSGYAQEYVAEGNYLPLEYINQLTAMPDFKESETYQSVYQYFCVDDMLHANIFYRGEFVGRLALPNPSDPCKQRYYHSILLRLKHHVEALYDTMGSFWHRKASSSRLGSMLMGLLNREPVELDVLNRLLANQGYLSGDVFCLIQMRSHFTMNESKLTEALASQLERMWPGSCCLTHNQELLVLMNLSQYHRTTTKLFNQELAVFLRESLLLAGLSRKFPKITDLEAAYQQTKIALSVGEELTPSYWYFKFDDYAYWELLHHGCQSFRPEQISHPAINTLAAYDRDNHTELCRTLKRYIANQYNAVSTANELFIARSTFLKRLARIEELTEIDLTKLQERIYLALSFELFDQYSPDN